VSYRTKAAAAPLLSLLLPPPWTRTAAAAVDLWRPFKTTRLDDGGEHTPQSLSAKNSPPPRANFNHHSIEDIMKQHPSTNSSVNADELCKKESQGVTSAERGGSARAKTFSSLPSSSLFLRVDRPTAKKGEREDSQPAKG